MVEDLSEEFARAFIFPMFQAGAIYEGQYFLGTSIAHALIAKRLKLLPDWDPLRGDPRFETIVASLGLK